MRELLAKLNRDVVYLIVSRNNWYKGKMSDLCQSDRDGGRLSIRFHLQVVFLFLLFAPPQHLSFISFVGFQQHCLFAHNNLQNGDGNGQEIHGSLSFKAVSSKVSMQKRIHVTGTNRACGLWLIFGKPNRTFMFLRTVFRSETARQFRNQTKP